MTQSNLVCKSIRTRLFIIYDLWKEALTKWCHFGEICTPQFIVFELQSEQNVRCYIHLLYLFRWLSARSANNVLVMTNRR